jgi:hypothetical protein
MKEYWLRISCPKCEKINWACDTSFHDITNPSIEAIKCWSCSHGFWIDEALAQDYYISSMADLKDDEEPMSLEQILEGHAYLTPGQEKPERPDQTPRRF